MKKTSINLYCQIYTRERERERERERALFLKKCNVCIILSLQPLIKTDSTKSQSADDVNNSLWKGMRNIAFTLMENASQDAETVEAASSIDVTEGVDCKLGRLQIGLSYDFQSLTLTLKVIQATGLVAKDFTGTSDPYVKILLLPDKRHKLVTKVKKKNLNPRWNESFLFEGWSCKT